MAIFSSNAFSAGHTGGVLRMVLGWLHIPVSDAGMQTLHYFIRKAAHFIAYGTLGALFFRAARGPLRRKEWRLSWALIAVVVSLITASVDELHQSFTVSREGSYRDVLLDMAGVVFVQVVIMLVYRRKSSG